MDELKCLRWKQRFVNFEKSYKALGRYVDKQEYTEIERAGIIQFFEISFELSWKLMKDYLEVLGFSASSPRETIKLANQTGLIDDGHVWIDALADRNLTVHTYDEKLSKEMVEDIVTTYYPAFSKLYQRLSKEL